MEKQLLLMAYSHSTIKSYRTAFAKFLVHFQRKTKEFIIEDLDKKDY